MFKKTNFHKKFLMLIMVLLILGSLVLSGCDSDNEAEPTNDAEMVLTNVAETLSAMMTQTYAAEPSATLEPSPTESPTATIAPSSTPFPTTASSGNSYVSTTTSSSCDQAGFVSDVTIPDGTKIEPGVEYTKTWLLSNDGTCTWNSSYKLVFYSGSQMDGPDSQEIIETDSYVYPGGTLQISVDLIAPTDAGTFTGYWVLQNASGVSFAIGTTGSPFYVQIVVGTSSTATPTPTSTSSSDATATATSAASTSTPTQTTVANTPTLTFTPMPSETPIPSNTPTETLVPTEDTSGGTGDGSG